MRPDAYPASPLQALIAAVPQQGQVRWIGVRPERLGDMLILDAVEARREAGLTGDHSRPGPRNARQVTLIQWEHLAVISALLGRDAQHAIKPEDLRRNIAVSGINLFSLKGRRFRMARRSWKLLAGASPAPSWNSAWASAPFRPCVAMAGSPHG